VAVTRFEVRSRSPLPGFAYERLDGRLHFSVDPDHEANRAVVDLERAARDPSGRVAFSADLTLLRPTAGGTRRLLVDVVNRGRRTVLRAFNRSAGEAQPGPEIDPGDGYLLDRGWTIAFLGWQWDVIPSDTLLGLEAPVALGPDGRPIQGQVIVQFQPNERERDHLLADRVHQPYPAADPEEPSAVMTVRDWQDGQRAVVPRERWRFAREAPGGPVADDTRVWLEGGFEAGRVYEVTYRTRSCPVVGAGMLAVRDVAPFLKAEGGLEHAFVYGVSQSGRFLRTFLYFGMNADEQGRPAYDGVLPHVAGARRGEFNHRFAQPSVQHTRSFGHLPPFHMDELLRRQRAVGCVPRIVTTNTSAEYWRGDCSLIHTDPAGQRDVEPPPEERIYHFAGTQHGAGALPFGNANPNDGAMGVHSFNVVDYSPLLRAALENLSRWAIEGVDPPPSAFPRLSDGTAVPMASALAPFAAIPGATVPDAALLPRMTSVDLGPDVETGVGRYPAATGQVYPVYVSAVDGDGNEAASLRLPDLTVPLATHAGWNPRHPDTGGVGQIIPMSGSTLPLPGTRAERTSSADPRLAIEERYRDRDDYLARVRAAAERLAAERYVLREDVDLCVALAAERWDAMVRLPTAVGASS
jgi:hypothetical protein